MINQIRAIDDAIGKNQLIATADFDHRVGGEHDERLLGFGKSKIA